MGIMCTRMSGKVHHELTEEFADGGKSTVSASCGFSHLCLPCQTIYIEVS